MLQFDSKGYLTPDHLLVCTLPEFRAVFVEGMPDEIRALIFENFVQFCRELLDNLGLPEIKIWANGSFTTRKRNPGDLDLVVFLDVGVSERHRDILRRLYQNDILQKEKRLDVYFVEVHPENHSKYGLMRSDMAYWMDKFIRTRPDRRGVIWKKGLIEMNITAHEISQV